MRMSPTSIRPLLASLLVISLTACGGGNETPSTSSLSFAYQQPATFQSGGPASCLHSFSPSHLTVTTDKGDVVYLNRDGTLHTTTLSNFGPGNHWLYVTDIGYCVERPDCPTATNGVSLNGIQLTRQVTTSSPLSCTALAFTVSPQGTVAP